MDLVQSSDRSRLALVEQRSAAHALAGGHPRIHTPVPPKPLTCIGVYLRDSLTPTYT